MKSLGKPRLRLLNKLLVLGLSFVVAASSLASENQADAVKQLQDLLSSFQSIQASFSQTTLDNHGNFLQEVKGEMKAKKPGYFYWETKPPLEQLLITNGSTLWLYDPDLEQVTIKSLDQRLSSTPALILNGNVSEIGSEYDISSASIEENVWRFTLRPKDPESLFEGLSLTFKQGKLTEMFLEDGLGQKTSFVFQDVDLSTDLDSDLFTFEPPEGIDIIRDQSQDNRG